MNIRIMLKSDESEASSLCLVAHKVTGARLARQARFKISVHHTWIFFPSTINSHCITPVTRHESSHTAKVLSQNDDVLLTPFSFLLKHGFSVE